MPRPQRKNSKSSLKKKLDKEFSRVIRLRDTCARCGRGAEEVVLQCSHIIGRMNLATRWDLKNGVALCYKCHIHWWHKEPLEADEWVRQYLGGYEYFQLKQRARQLKQWEVWEMEALLENLKGIK